jgi:hypothetical protein
MSKEDQALGGGLGKLSENATPLLMESSENSAWRKPGEVSSTHTLKGKVKRKVVPALN